MSQPDIAQLKALTPAQFEELTHVLGVPPEYLPQKVSQVELATTVLRYLQQQADGEQRLREVLRRLEPPALKIDKENNPYLGLDFFRTEDQDRFFGRDAVAGELLRLVRQHRFVALIGASGSGKSSLLYAGLIPRLQEPRDNTALSGVVPVIFRPRSEPFAEFANAYLSAKYPDLSGEDRKTQSKKLTAQLTSAELEIKDLVELLLEARGTREVLLIADQFEELYTLNPPATQRTVVATLLTLLDPALPCRLLLSYRADFTGEAIDSFGDALNQHGKLFLERMNTEELREAIEKPAQHKDTSFETGLAARMIQEVGEEPGYLPLLQFALLRLWGEREGTLLTHRGYERIGGVQRALAGYADSVLARFSDEEQTRIRRIFMQLVRPGSRSGEADTRQVATREQIADWPLVTALADVRLVVTGQRDGQDTVEVAHEALIQHWQTLRDWINEDRLALRLIADVRHQAREWDTAERAASHLPRWNAKLEQAEELLGNPRFVATALESAFLRACRELKEKEEREEREKQRKLRQRFRWAVAVSLVALATSLLAWLMYGEAEKQTQVAEQKKGEALRAQSLFLADLSRQQTEKGHPVEGMLLALEGLPTSWDKQGKPNRPYVPEVETQFYNAFYAPHEILRLNHENAVNSATFSPDGTRILTTSSYTARIWDAQTGKLIHQLIGHGYAYIRGLFSPDGKLVATTGGNDKTVRIWNADNGKLLHVLRGHCKAPLPDASPFDCSVNDATFSADSSQIVTTANDKVALIWNVSTGKLITSIKSDEYISGAEFNGEGSQIVIKSNMIRLFNSKTGGLLYTFKDSVKNVRFNRTGNRLSTLEGNSIVQVFTVTPDKLVPLSTFKTDNKYPYAFTMTYDGSRVITISNDDTVRVWDADTGKEIRSAKHCKNEVSCFFRLWQTALSQNNELLLTISENSVKLWSLYYSGSEPTTLRSSCNKDSSCSIVAAAFHPNSQRVLIASGNTAHVWDIEPAKVGSLYGHTKRVTSISFSSDNKRILTASMDRTAKIWDLAGNKPLTVLSGHCQNYKPEDSNDECGVLSAKFSKDNRLVVTTGGDNTVRIWDAETGKEVSIFKENCINSSPLNLNPKCVNNANFSHDSSLVVTTGYSGRPVRIWDIASKKITIELNNDCAGVSSSKNRLCFITVLFSPDDSKLLTFNSDGIGNLWDLANTNYPVLTVKHCEDDSKKSIWGSCAGDAAFNSTGNLLITTGFGKTIKIWNIDTGNRLGTLKTETECMGGFIDGFSCLIAGIRFNKYENRIIGSSDQDGLCFWDISGLKNATTTLPKELFPLMIINKKYSTLNSDESLMANADSGFYGLNIQRIFPNTQSLVKYAQDYLPYRLNVAQRKEFFLPQNQNLIDAQAFLQQGESYAKEGNLSEAINNFRMALEKNPLLGIFPQQKAEILAIMGMSEKADNLAKEGKISEAIAYYKRVADMGVEFSFALHDKAKQLHANTLVSKSEPLAREGKIAKAVSNLNVANNIYENVKIGSSILINVCRSGFIYNQLDVVLDICNEALKVNCDDSSNKFASSSCYNSRGLIRAISGDFDGSIEDFRVALENNRHSNLKQKKQLQEWIEALQKGKNPFTQELLESVMWYSW